MKFAVLVSGYLLSVVALEHDPSPLLADDGRDLSFLLKCYDGPAPILHRAVKGNSHTVPRTLQVERVPVRRAPDGLVDRPQGCLDPGYQLCPDGFQCCPAGAVCGPGTCCPAGNLACARNCKGRHLSLCLSLPPIRSSGCPDALGDCCLSGGCCPANQVSASTLLTTWQNAHLMFHRSASLRLTGTLGAALAVKPVLPSPVSEPSRHYYGSLLNLNSLRVRGPCNCVVSWRDFLLPCWCHLCPRCSRQCNLSRFDPHLQPHSHSWW